MEGIWGAPRIGAPKEGEKAVDAGVDILDNTVIVIIIVWQKVSSFF